MNLDIMKPQVISINYCLELASITILVLRPLLPSVMATLIPTLVLKISLTKISCWKTEFLSNLSSKTKFGNYYLNIVSASNSVFWIRGRLLTPSIEPGIDYKSPFHLPISFSSTSTMRYSWIFRMKFLARIGCMRLWGSILLKI